MIFLFIIYLITVIFFLLVAAWVKTFEQKVFNKLFPNLLVKVVATIFAPVSFLLIYIYAISIVLREFYQIVKSVFSPNK